MRWSDSIRHDPSVTTWRPIRSARPISESVPWRPPTATTASALVTTTRLRTTPSPVAMGMRTLPVLVDRDQLTQASLNLLDNAIMHTQERGLVRLSGKREDSSVVLHLHNAQPFASKHLPDLFDRPLSR